MEKTFEKKLTEAFKIANIDLNEEQISLFEKYYDLLVEWNEKFNLTTILNEDDVIKKHFLDSVLSCNNITKNSYIIDIGAGAGFPSIPLKIIRNDLEIVMVDSVNKKIIFLQEVIKALCLKKINAIHSRVEDLAIKNDFREKFDFVVSRAVSRLNTLVEYSLPFVRIGGTMIAYKSVDLEDEVKESTKAISLLGGSDYKIIDVSFGDLNRKLLLIKKIKNSPKKFPRSGNKPRLSPIFN